MAAQISFSRRLMFVSALLVTACLLSVLAAGSASAAVPSVSTGGTGAGSILKATLYGSVNPNGLETTYYFEYGPTSSYGSKTNSVSAGGGTSSLSATAQLGSLSPSTTYNYRLVASNSSGTTYGSNFVFKTADPAKPTSSVLYGPGTVENNFVAKPYITDLSEVAAKVYFLLSPGGLQTEYFVQYDEQTKGNYLYSSPVEKILEDGKITASVQLEGLDPGTRYRYRLVATNTLGGSFSGEAMFKTLGSSSSKSLVGSRGSGVNTLAGRLSPLSHIASRCIVPELRYKTLAQAKRRLADTNCRIGKVTGRVSGRRRVVLKQSVRAVTLLPAGSPVDLKFGLRPKLR